MHSFKPNISLPHAPIFIQWLQSDDHKVSSYYNPDKEENKKKLSRLLAKCQVKL